MDGTGDVVDERVTSAPSDSGGPDFDLFVVHAAADAEFVRGYLLPALNLPRSRVLLVDQLTLGAPIIAEIDRGVSRSRFTIAVLSPAYLEDRWAVFGEQLASHLSVEDGRIIPLRLTACKLPLRLEARVALDFTDRAAWDGEAARLRTLLQTTAPAREQIHCPYPGMRPFSQDEASRFFGRGQEIDDLIGRLDRGEREIYVIGPSGSGKSSLVQAGLLHELEAGSSRLGRSFAIRVMRPGERPSERLSRALEGELATPATTVGALLARHPPAERVLVFVDQLEELFTLADAAERQRFVTALRGLRAEPRCCVLLALRADFFGALLDSELGPDLAGRTSPLVVAPLRGAALAQAITEPARHAGVHLEARLCDRLVADAAAEPGALPLVQETLRMLWDKRRQRLLGLAEYEALGEGGRGLDVAIARRAGTTMGTLTLAQQAIARRVLLRLVSFGEGRPDTRRQQQIQALRSAADGDAEFLHALQRLVEDRLITVDGADGADDALADLSHEALITGWPSLRAWIARRRADEQRRRRLEAKVGEWIERGRGAASLLDPVELSEAVEWMQSDAARELGYGAGLPALVAASRTESEKVERQAQAVRFAAGMTYLEQGRVLLLDGHPMQALPYFVAARTEGLETPVLRMLFAQASRHLPCVTFAGHTASVRGVAFSPDGRYVVTASNDATAQIWEASTGEPVTPPLEHRGFVWSAAFDPAGGRVVTASADHTARIWSASTGEPLTPPLEHHGLVRTAAFSADGTRVVTASDDRTARVWDASTGMPLSWLRHESIVASAGFSPEGGRVVTASFDHTARVWDAVTGEPLTAPLEHLGFVYEAAFDRVGTRVVTASRDHTARVWDASTGQPVTPPLAHQGVVLAAAFNPAGTRVVTASDDRAAQVWDASTGMPVGPRLVHQGAVFAVGFSPDGACVVTTSWDKTARVWDASTGKPVTPPLEHQGVVYAAAFSPDGTRLITASEDQAVRIWDVSQDTQVTMLLGHKAAVLGASFSPNGRRVVTASEDHTARVWDASTGKLAAPAYKHLGFVERAVFNLDGTRVVTASDDHAARVWNASTGSPVTPPLAHQARVYSAVFSRAGTHVVTASRDHTAQVWDASTGQPVTPPLEHQGFVWRAAFSPDGTRVVTASNDGTAQVWDAATGRPVTPPLAHQSFVWRAAFSPDGTRVVTASHDKTARVWDAVTGQPVTTPFTHQGSVNGAVFSPDGLWVATASYDRTGRVWDAWTGRPVTPPLAHEGIVRTAVFSPDGTWLVTASDDRTARTWDASTGKPVTPPLEHEGIVLGAAFSPDGTRVVTASRDQTARVWTVPRDEGGLEDWLLLARCSPFALVNHVLTSNPDPLRMRPPR